MENLKKLFLSIFALVLMMSNFSTAEANEDTPYIYYGSVSSFVDKINTILNRNGINYRLPSAFDRSSHNQHLIYFGAGKGENNNLSSSCIRFDTDYGGNNIHTIKCRVYYESDYEESQFYIFVALLATGLSQSSMHEFVDELQKYASRAHHRSSKTFKIWNSQMGRYIVLNVKEIEPHMFALHGGIGVTITGEFR